MAGQADYLKQLRRFLKRIYTPQLAPIWEKSARKGSWFSVGLLRHWLAYAFAVMWQIEGRERDLREAKQLLLQFPEAHSFACWAAAGAYQIIESSLSQSQRDSFAEYWTSFIPRDLEHFCSNISLKHAYGNNHKVMACLWADLARQLFPRHAAPYGFEAVTDRVWDLWWERRDFQEQGTGYEGFTEHAHCIWAKVRGVEKEFYSSPSILNMFERNMLIVTPGGMIAAYGDSGHPVQPSHWPAIFERVARATRDGRFRECANDIFEGGRRTGYWQRISPVEDLMRHPLYLGQCIYRNFAEDAMAMADAALHCDDDLKPRPRPLAGVIRRLPMNEALRKGERGGGRINPARYHDQQVALTGGAEAETYALLSVGRSLGHDHPDAGAIQLLAHGDTELLGTNGYLSRELYFHNTFFAQAADRPLFPDDRDGEGFAGAAECHGTVEELELNGNSSYCRLRFEGFHGLAANLTREFVLDRNGILTVTDVFQVLHGVLQAGLIFHAERLRRLAPNVYRLRLDTLKMNDGMLIGNLPGALEVRFAFGEGEGAVRHGLRLPAILDTLPAYQEFPCAGYKKFWKSSYSARRCLTYSRQVAAGQTVRFVTVLTPV